MSDPIDGETFDLAVRLYSATLPSPLDRSNILRSLQLALAMHVLHGYGDTHNIAQFVTEYVGNPNIWGRRFNEARSVVASLAGPVS